MKHKRNAIRKRSHRILVSAYVEPTHYATMRRIKKLLPTYSYSRQINVCLDYHLRWVEQQLRKRRRTP